MIAARDKQRRRRFYFRAALFYLFVLFLYGPILIMGLLSFQEPLASLTFPMQGFSLHWFEEALDPGPYSRQDFRMPFLRSLALAVLVMSLTMAISFLAGLAFRRNFKGSLAIFYLAVASLVAPSVLISLGIGMSFTSLGLESQWYSGGLGAHLSWTLPFGMLIMLAVFSRLDPRLEEVARDQGANRWQTLRHVIVPITLPGLIGVALFGFTLSYDEYARISTVVGEHNTLPVELVNAMDIAASPTIYAIGTMTTVFSLIVIGISFLAIYLVQRRRSSRIVPRHIPRPNS